MNIVDWIKMALGVVGFFSAIWIIAYAIAHGITLGIGRAKRQLTKEEKK